MKEIVAGTHGQRFFALTTELYYKSIMLITARILVLLLACYLVLVAVFTMQILDEKSDESQAVSVDRNLGDIGRTTPFAIISLSKTIEVSNTKKISDIKGDLVLQNPQLMQYIVDYDSKITSQTELLYQQPTEFQSFSDDERRRIVLRFRDQVHRSPLIYVQNYSDKLQSFFEKWIEDWTQKERECRGKITTQLLSLGQLITSTRQALDAPANVTPDPKFPELRLKGPRFPTWPPQDLSPDDLSKSCDFVSLSSTAIPVLEADDRHIGPFDFLYDWLVRSGSRTLTLIVGLVGFGVFGAMFSSYIRGGRASQDVFRDFVRGVASVILTYVLIIGGLTVVTKEASPNPYALFAACFIASVFSKRIFQVAKDNLKI